MLTCADHERLVQRVEAGLTAMSANPPRTVEAREERHHLLVTLEDQLRASLSLAAPEAPSSLARRIELLGRVRELRGELGASSVAGRLDVLGRIQQNLRNLREDASTNDLLETSVAELLDACG